MVVEYLKLFFGGMFLDNIKADTEIKREKVYNPQDNYYINTSTINQCFRCVNHFKCTVSCEGLNFEDKGLKHFRQEQRKYGIQLFIKVVGVIFTCVALFLAFHNFNTSPNDDISNWRFKAYMTAKDKIEQQLKNPSSANFASIDSSDIKEFSNKVKVNSYVDAKNSFGAMVRTHFSVVVNKDSWTIDFVETSE